MRIYDPADGIVYVHLAPRPAGHLASGTGHSDRRLPAGYANQSPQTRLAVNPRSDLSAREVGGPAPLFVVLAGGAEAVTDTDRSLAPPALRLA